MKYWFYILPFIIMWFLQLYLSKKQTKNYLQNIREVKKHKYGHMGVGIVRAKLNLGPGIILIIATDLDGNIIEYRKMEGSTIFAKFKNCTQYLGKSTQMVLNEITKKKEKKAFIDALKLINDERSKNNLVTI